MGWHADATHAPPRQSWPHAPQLLGSLVVSSQPPPVPLLLDAELLEAPPAPPALEAELPTLVEAVLVVPPPAPPAPEAELLMLVEAVLVVLLDPPPALDTELPTPDTALLEAPPALG